MKPKDLVKNMRKSLERKLFDKHGGRPISVPPKGSKKGGKMTTTTVQDREAARRMKDKLPRNYTPTKSGGANNYKLPTRPADGSGTGI